MRAQPAREAASGPHWWVPLGVLAVVVGALVVLLLVGTNPEDLASGPSAAVHSTPAPPARPEVLPPGHFFRVVLPRGASLDPARVAVVEAYQNAAEAFARAAGQPGSAGAGLGRYWTGAALRRQQAVLRRLARTGRVVRSVDGAHSGIWAGPVTFQDPRHAAFVFCFHDEGVSVARAPGDLPGRPPADEQFVAALVRVRSTWLVADRRPLFGPQRGHHPCSP